MKSIFILPAASIPAAFLTRTLSFIMRRRFEASTTAIIIGRPSGTAITMTVRPRVNAEISFEMRNRKLLSFRSIACPAKPLSRTKTLKRYANATSAAIMYPIMLICFASFVSLRRRGLSRGSSCISREISPINVASPTAHTTASPSPEIIPQPLNTDERSDGSARKTLPGIFNTSRLSPVRAD